MQRFLHRTLLQVLSKIGQVNPTLRSNIFHGSRLRCSRFAVTCKAPPVQRAYPLAHCIGLCFLQDQSNPGQIFGRVKALHINHQRHACDAVISTPTSSTSHMPRSHCGGVTASVRPPHPLILPPFSWLSKDYKDSTMQTLLDKVDALCELCFGLD